MKENVAILGYIYGAVAVVHMLYFWTVDLQACSHMERCAGPMIESAVRAPLWPSIYINEYH